MAKKQLKQTLLIGALTSTFGVFVSKILGLFYLTPLSEFAGEANMTFYSIAYSYYDVLLKISGAGIPFAIAALVAKYCAKEDYKTALLAKKMGTSIILLFSFTIGALFLIFSNFFASNIMGASASAKDIEQLRNLFCILAIAVIIVPYMSSIRGYYQGLKRLDLYAASQVLEQFIRVFTILFGGYIAVNIFKFEGIYAVYVAIAGAGLGAIASIIFLKIYSKHDDERINDLVSKQTSNSLSQKLILKELVFLGLPYILISVFGSASILVNSSFFLNYASKVGIDIESAKLSYGILNANCNKLLAIPEVLTLGFSSGLVPYLTESFEKNDIDSLKKQIGQIFSTVLFFLIPIICVFNFFAEDIYFVMYGNKNIELASHLFRISTLVGLTDTICPILSHIMLTLRFKKEAFLTLIVAFLIKLLTFFPLVRNFGAEGMVYSTFLSTLSCIIIYIVLFNKMFEFKFSSLFKNICLICLCSIISIGLPGTVRHIINIGVSNRLISLLVLGIFGLAMVFIYLTMAIKTKLTKDIFEIEGSSIKKVIKGLLK